MKSCPIAICGKSPDGYRGAEYKKLAPKYWFFKEWKENHDNNFYVSNFYKEVLNPLNIEQIMEGLRLLINSKYGCIIQKEPQWWNSIPFDIYSLLRKT